MEGKTVILSLLLLSLVMAQFQAEAKSCCPTTTARNIYNTCRATGGSQTRCASLSGCRHVTETRCPEGWEKFNAILEGDEAKVVCCPSVAARNRYDMCRMVQEKCVSFAGCKLVTGSCPSGWDNFNAILEADGDGVTEYCKLGCVSSVCGALTTLQNSDPTKIVNGAVEKCTNACSAFCIKGSIAAPEVA